MAASTIDELQVIITAQNKEFKAALNDISKQLNDVSGDAQQSGGKMEAAMQRVGQSAKIAAVAVGTAFAGLSVAAIKSYASYEQLTGGVDTLFKDSSKTVQKYAQDAYKTAGLSANQYMETVTSFSASLLQGLKGDTKAAADYADMAVTDMSDNANKMGTDMGRIQDAYQGFAKDNFTMLDNLKLGYGGTATEMARLVNDSKVMGDSFEATAENVKDIPFDKLIQAIHKTQDAMGITGTTAKEASETISGSWYSVKASFENVLTGIEGSGKAFSKGVLNLFEQLAKKVPRIVGEMARGIATALEDILIAKFGEFGRSAIEAGQVFISSIVNISRQIADYLLPKISALVSIVTSRLVPILLELTQNILMPLAGIIGTSLVVALGLAIDATTLLLQAVTFLYEILKPFAPAILAVVAAYTAYQIIAGIVTGVQIAMTGAMVAGTTASGAYALGIGAVTLAQTAAATATTLWNAALSLLNPVTLGLAAAVAAVTLALEAMKLSQANANLEAQNTITFQERETQLRLMGRDAIKAQEDALRSYTDAKAEQTNASLALMSAEDQQTAASQRLNDMIVNGVDPASREYKRAQLELESANYRVKEAQDKLGESTDKTTRAYDDWGDGVWAGIRAGKEDELQKLAQAGKYEQVNQKLKDLADSTQEYKDVNGQMTKFSKEDMEQMALSIGKSIGNVKQEYKKFWDASKQSVDEAARNVDQVKSQFTQSGRNFSQGIASGIEGESWRVESAARNTAYRANAAYKNALDIHSPSRVMKEGGGNFSLGIAEGIVSKTSEVVAAAKSISKVAMSAADFSGMNFTPNLPTSSQLSSKLDLSVNAQLLGIDSRQTPVNVQLDGETLLSFVIDGVNGKTFMTNSSSLIV